MPKTLHGFYECALTAADGLHVLLVGRPAGLLQLRGSNLLLWEEMFPRTPVELADETLRAAEDALVGLAGEATV